MLPARGVSQSIKALSASTADVIARHGFERTASAVRMGGLHAAGIAGAATYIATGGYLASKVFGTHGAEAADLSTSADLRTAGPTTTIDMNDCVAVEQRLQDLHSKVQGLNANRPDPSAAEYKAWQTEHHKTWNEYCQLKDRYASISNCNYVEPAPWKPSAPQTWAPEVMPADGMPDLAKLSFSMNGSGGYAWEDFKPDGSKAMDLSGQYHRFGADLGLKYGAHDFNVGAYASETSLSGKGHFGAFERSMSVTNEVVGGQAEARLALGEGLRVIVGGGVEHGTRVTAETASATLGGQTYTFARPDVTESGTGWRAVVGLEGPTSANGKTDVTIGYGEHWRTGNQEIDVGIRHTETNLAMAGDALKLQAQILNDLDAAIMKLRASIDYSMTTDVGKLTAGIEGGISSNDEGYLGGRGKIEF
ncbi:MAG: hypothetical protein WAX89_07965 [Alphaproteobacteria bacterium]